jgi:hypothetical protein
MNIEKDPQNQTKKEKEKLLQSTLKAFAIFKALICIQSSCYMDLQGLES